MSKVTGGTVSDADSGLAMPARFDSLMPENALSAGDMVPFPRDRVDPDSPEGLRLSLTWWVVGVGRAWKRLLDEELRSSGQTQARWRTLAWAHFQPGIRQGDLAKRLGIARPTLVPVLDTLEQQGLIERRSVASDRRVREIYLTDKADPVVDRIAQQVRAIRNGVLDGISDEDLATCLSVLYRVHERIEAASSRSD